LRRAESSKAAAEDVVVVAGEDGALGLALERFDGAEAEGDVAEATALGVFLLTGGDRDADEEGCGGRGRRRTTSK